MLNEYYKMKKIILNNKEKIKDNKKIIQQYKETKSIKKSINDYTSSTKEDFKRLNKLKKRIIIKEY